MASPCIASRAVESNARTYAGVRQRGVFSKKTSKQYSYTVPRFLSSYRRVAHFGNAVCCRCPCVHLLADAALLAVTVAVRCLAQRIRAALELTWSQHLLKHLTTRVLMKENMTSQHSALTSKKYGPCHDTRVHDNRSMCLQSMMMDDKCVTYSGSDFGERKTCVAVTAAPTAAPNQGT